MTRYFAFFSLLAVSAAGLLPFCALADESALIRADVRLVLLDVSVRNHAGTFVSGLSKNNFEVFENGHEQQIKVFAHHDAPVTVGILVDTSYSMTPKRNEVLRAAETFIRESNEHDEVFVLDFNNKVRRGLPEGVTFSSDRKKLHEALNRGKPAGQTALYDAVIEGLKQVKSGTRDRRTLVLISDGRDNASKHTRAEMLREVEESVVTIYTIGLYEPDAQDQDPALLRKLAKESGGEAYFPASPDKMDEVCSRIAKDIRQRYTLGYTPPELSAAHDLRQIRLRVKGPDNAHLVAKARTSYRYDHDTNSPNATSQH